MTRLAIVKEQLAQTLCRLSDTEIAAALALTTKPDAKTRVKDPSNGYYRLDAYGLTRANGGYIVQRFCCKGQTDFISFWSFETWKRVYGQQLTFSAAANYFEIKQRALLFPKTEETPCSVSA